MAGSVPQAGLAELPAPSPLDPPELANKRAGWRKFPMVMRHPAFRPAVISNDRTVDANGREKWISAPPGQAIQWPPVTVLNEHQEELHLAKGYVGSGDPAAMNRAEVAPEPPGYVYQAYPRMLEDGTIDEGPDAPQPPDNFYPYWCRMPGWPDTLVEDQAEHNALLRSRGYEQPPVEEKVDDRDAQIALLKDEIAEMKAIMQAMARGQLGASPAPATDAAEPAGPDKPTAPVEAAPVDLEVNAEVDLQAPERLQQLVDQADDPAIFPGAAAEIERELEQVEDPPVETATAKGKAKR